MKERLKMLRNSLELNQTEFAEKTNISRSMIAAFETGSRDMKELHISQICTAFNVNPDWLRTGNGSMFVENDNATLEVLCRENNLSTAEQSMLRVFLSLPPTSRAGVLDYYNALVADAIANYANEPAHAAPAKTIE